MIIPNILKGKDMPKHLAIDATRVRSWSEKNSKDIKEAVRLNLEKLDEFIDLQIKKDIPILTLQVSTKTEEEIEGLKSFFKKISSDQKMHDKKVRIYVIGDWYSAEPELSEVIREAMEKTKDYDQYFLNFGVKYDGQQEILTAAKLILKKAEAEKLGIDSLTPEMLKDNMPSSYFMPPELIIINNNHYTGLLLWDCKNSKMFFTNKHWLDFERKDFDRAIDFFNETKN